MSHGLVLYMKDIQSYRYKVIFFRQGTSATKVLGVVYVQNVYQNKKIRVIKPSFHQGNGVKKAGYLSGWMGVLYKLLYGQK